MNRSAAIADVQARGTGPLTLKPVYDGIRESCRLADGSDFYHFTFAVVNGQRRLGRSLTGTESSGTGMLMWMASVHWLRRRVLRAGLVVVTCLSPVSAYAIEVHPTAEQIQIALDRGKEAGQKQRPPDMFYARFGATDELHSNGFLITKLGGLSVMATHMALRGLQPSETDVAQVLEGQTLLVSTVIFGNAPNFAVDCYMVFDQGGTTINPVTVRFDGVANRTAAWPESPRFKAKVVASFNYTDFDPSANTTIVVFPANGGESSFLVDFSQIH
ncbi:MAG: hypothetical protein SGJ26_14325 [Nitrospirota bacterium]|nr:hypothetical protein [Nitrospirota bacterium]